MESNGTCYVVGVYLDTLTSPILQGARPRLPRPLAGPAHMLARGRHHKETTPRRKGGYVSSAGNSTGTRRCERTSRSYAICQAAPVVASTQTVYQPP